MNRLLDIENPHMWLWGFQYLRIPKQSQRKPKEKGQPRPVLGDALEATITHVLKGILSPVETLIVTVW